MLAFATSLRLGAGWPEDLFVGPEDTPSRLVAEVLCSASKAPASRWASRETMALWMWSRIRASRSRYRVMSDMVRKLQAALSV